MPSNKPRSPRLAELINSLRVMVKNNSSHASMKPTVDKIALLLRKKREQILDRYTISLPHWEDTLKASPDQIET